MLLFSVLEYSELKPLEISHEFFHSTAYKYIFEQYSHPIDIAIILGSGLGPLADEIENPVIIDYQDIPFFPKSTIPGHEGKLYIGKIAGKTVCAM